MNLHILKTGLSDTIQDGGRYGYAKWGVNPGGAMDRYAAQAANALAGNALDDAVIEIHFPSCEIRFDSDVLISLTGGDFTPVIDNNILVPLWRPVIVKKNAVLSFTKKMGGVRCYLSVHGGFHVMPWLGSASTDQKISAGGFEGRALKKGDAIPLHMSRYAIQPPQNNTVKVLPWGVNFNAVYHEPETIYFVQGNEWSWLTEESQRIVTEKMFSVDTASDRMGYYLKQEETLKFRQTEELLSSAVSFGTIQALPGGQLVVLMAGHQTTGGYPRIGYVIGAHLPKLSQRAANEKLRLKIISASAAEKMLFSLQQELQLIQQACREKLDRYYEKH